MADSQPTTTTTTPPVEPIPDSAPVETAAAASPLAAIETPAPPPPKKRAPRVPLKKRIWTLTVRAYAGALVLVIAIVCLTAIIYLFKAVFTPATLPPTFAQWQGRLDPAALREANIPGVTTGAGRAPMSHYHKVDRWFTPDPRNTCTVSGCHSPLPHPPKTRIGAFPNLHVTFLACTVCHEPIGAGGAALDLRWVRTADYAPQDPPAVLRLIALLEDLKPGKPAALEAHPRIVALLSDVVIVTAGDEELDDLRVEIESSVADSPVWRQSVQRLAAVLPGHARGEYAAKLTRRHPATDAANIARLTKSYFAAPEGTSQRKDIETQLHQGVVPRPNGCSMCHAPDGRDLDFAALGYSPRRAAALKTLPLARMVEQIRNGENFQLPKLMEEKQ
jgi:hypothetical protein